MDNFKRFMTFSRSERIAILTIVSLIVIILIAKYLIINNPPKREYFKHDLDSIIARQDFVIDSMRIADSIEKAKLSFRAKREHSPQVNKSSDNHHVISSEPRAKREGNREISEISPLPAVGRKDVVIDINAADTTMLKKLSGIGSAYAKRIVEYREKLGGYCETDQLLEVYGMDSLRFNGLKDYVKTDSLFVPNKLRINSDAFKVLLKHPYLEYDDVKKIVNHREQKGLITSWEQLTKIVGNTINPKLRYYIDYQ